MAGVYAAGPFPIELQRALSIHHLPRVRVGFVITSFIPVTNVGFTMTKASLNHLPEPPPPPQSD